MKNFDAYFFSNPLLERRFPLLRPLSILAEFLFQQQHLKDNYKQTFELNTLLLHMIYMQNSGSPNFSRTKHQTII